MKRASCKSRTPTSKALTGTKRVRRCRLSAIRNPQSAIERADDGIRTRDLRFTKPLLYQLSYVGARRKRLHPGIARASAKLLAKAPNSKLQHPEKLQTSTSKTSRVLLFGISVIGISMELGCWCLL